MPKCNDRWLRQGDCEVWAVAAAGDTGHPADGARYEATRQESWRQISALLGLDQKPQQP